MEMLSNSLKKIKIVFSILFIIAIAGFIGIAQSEAFEKGVAALEREMRYWEHRLAISSPNNSRLAGVGAILGIVEDSAGSTVYENKGSAQSIPVLVYHGVTDAPDRFSITPEALRDHLFSLKKNGYQTITLEQFIAFLKNETDVPAKSFLLTFDDGRVDSYEEADPILRALDFTAVMFVATSQSFPQSDIDSTFYIDADTIKRMVDSGRWEIGSHAMQQTGGMIQISESDEEGNFLSNKKWLTQENRLESDDEYEHRIRDELTLSREKLESLTGKPVRSFSYPFGDFGQQTKNNSNAEAVIAKTVGANYDVAFRQIWPSDPKFSLNYRGLNHYYLFRIEPDPFWSTEKLLETLETKQEKSVPFYDDFNFNQGWKRTWGTLRFDSSEMIIASTDKTTGAFVMLDGSRSWNNYALKVDLLWEKGSHISLVARYKDEHNYVSCTYSDKDIRIDEKIAGQIENLVNAPLTIPIAHDSAELAMSIDGNVTTCYVGPSVVASTGQIDRSLDQGGIGFRIWDEILGNASISIKSLMVVDAQKSDYLISQMSEGSSDQNDD